MRLAERHANERDGLACPAREDGGHAHARIRQPCHRIRHACGVRPSRLSACPSHSSPRSSCVWDASVPLVGVSVTLVTAFVMRVGCVRPACRRIRPARHCIRHACRVRPSRLSAHSSRSSLHSSCVSGASVPLVGAGLCVTRPGTSCSECASRRDMHACKENAGCAVVRRRAGGALRRYDTMRPRRYGDNTAADKPTRPPPTTSTDVDSMSTPIQLGERT